jgi:hypothetical protein
MQYNDGYDGYYEAQGYAAAAEAEAQEQLEYQDYLGKLLEKGETALFAAYVALDWLRSKEFAESGLSPIQYIEKKRDSFLFKGREFTSEKDELDEPILPF